MLLPLVVYAGLDPTANDLDAIVSLSSGKPFAAGAATLGSATAVVVHVGADPAANDFGASASLSSGKNLCGRGCSMLPS